METISRGITTIIEEGKVFRKCKECRLIKELNTYNFHRRETENGWRGRCRVCHNKHVRQVQEMTKAEIATNKVYREKYKRTKPLETLLKVAKGNAKRRYKDFNINIEDLKLLWDSQKGICYYTNRPMKFHIGFEDSVSIDRINSSIGYLKGNIALCQSKVNIMKNDATIEELLIFCEDILNNKRFK